MSPFLSLACPSHAGSTHVLARMENPGFELPNFDINRKENSGLAQNVVVFSGVQRGVSFFSFLFPILILLLLFS